MIVASSPQYTTMPGQNGNFLTKKYPNDGPSPQLIKLKAVREPKSWSQNTHQQEMDLAPQAGPSVLTGQASVSWAPKETSPNPPQG
jgi:hypothetical protein